MSLASRIVKLVTTVVPNRIWLAPLRFEPLIWRRLPPAAGPLDESRPVTPGAGAVYGYWSALERAEGPEGVVTGMCTVLARWGGHGRVRGGMGVMLQRVRW